MSKTFPAPFQHTIKERMARSVHCTNQAPKQQNNQELNKRVRDNTKIQALKALSERLSKTRAQATPKPKFSFSKKNASAISINDAAELAAKRRLVMQSTASSTTSSFATTPLTAPQTPANEPTAHNTTINTADNEMQPAATVTATENTRKPSFSNATNINISNHANIHIMLPVSATSATSGTSGTITNIRNSIIDMSISSTSAFATLTLKNIKNSLIICGHVDGAVHITGVENSVLLVATRQFRMHESRNVGVYMLCRSRPIIEDCVGIEFAELPACHVSFFFFSFFFFDYVCLILIL
jgi:hypothetical protein